MAYSVVSGHCGSDFGVNAISKWPQVQFVKSPVI